ncbi:hypothetical protein ACLB2K_015876 [Fragaria x ananassa]
MLMNVHDPISDALDLVIVWIWWICGLYSPLRLDRQLRQAVPGGLAELSSNPLVNAWYAGEDPTAPTEIGDLCKGLYGTGGGGGYIGQVMKDREGRTFNVNGRKGRKFLLQWIWSPKLKACAGPNALD